MAPRSPAHSDPPASPTSAKQVPAVDARGAMGIQVGDFNTQYNEYKLLPAATVSWPVVVGRAPRLAEAYLDRPAQRDSVRTALNNPAVSTTAPVAVLTGGGGTGKTQLATDAFDRALNLSKVDSDNGCGVPRVDLALWVTASSPEAIVSTYAQAYAALSPEMAGTEPAGAAGGGSQIDATQQAEAFLAWLTTTDRAWLVVLDDVTDPAVLAGASGRAGMWPTGPSGRVILTTRRRDAALTGPAGGGRPGTRPGPPPPPQSCSPTSCGCSVPTTRPP